MDIINKTLIVTTSALMLFNGSFSGTAATLVTGATNAPSISSSKCDSGGIVTDQSAADACAYKSLGDSCKYTTGLDVGSCLSSYLNSCTPYYQANATQDGGYKGSGTDWSGTCISGSHAYTCQGSLTSAVKTYYGECLP